MKKARFIHILMLLFCSIVANAQTAAAPVEMADGMRSNGKIYVVVGVLLIILIGILVYLITIDRKITRVEKSIQDSTKK